MPDYLVDLIAFAGGYLLGSIPFAFLVTKAFGLGDFRLVGSGNVGTTNVLRTGNRVAAALTLLGDVGKGVVAVLIARQFGDIAALIAALGAFTGHIFPVWLNFKGGKGVATYIGIVFALAWPAALLVCATWLIVAAISRASSLSALVAAALSPLYMWFLASPIYAGGAALLSALIFITHRANITRLLNGEEPRMGSKRAQG